MSTEILTAIVLGAVNLGESDRLMRLLTRERGQVTARARGARKSRKRYGGKLDRYCLIRAHLRIRRDRAALGDVDLLQPFLGVREDLVRAAMADHLLELVRIVAREEEPAAELFGLTVRALTTLDAGPTPPEGWLHAVALELMRLSGFALSLDACVSCGVVVPPRRAGAALSVQGGGVLCPEHGSADPAALPLRPGELDHLRALGRLDLAESRGLEAGPVVERRLRGVVRRFCEAHLERRLKTADFLDPLLDNP